MTDKTAVILFNLGGPDSLMAVKPFLFNLFNDPVIIDLPAPVRWLLAKMIAARRAPVASKIYTQLGGASPLLANTQVQAQALQAAFDGPGELRCFIAMRYWHPRADEVALEVKAFAPDRIVLLPLYPQYSSTTTGSSLAEWRHAVNTARLHAPTTTFCCYADNPGFITAIADRVRAALRAALRAAGDTRKPPRVLFTAHGLPQKIVDRGDPYQWQVELTAAAVVAKLAIEGLDWQLCYQSRVGRLVWLQPYTGDALKAAGRDGVPVVVVPIAFTSEHSETLVELDVDYRALAAAAGVPAYFRVGTVGADAAFIDGLAALIRQALESPGDIVSDEGGRCCPPAYGGCAFAGPAGNVQ